MGNSNMAMVDFTDGEGPPLYLPTDDVAFLLEEEKKTRKKKKQLAHLGKSVILNHCRLANEVAKAGAYTNIVVWAKGVEEARFTDIQVSSKGKAYRAQIDNKGRAFFLSASAIDANVDWSVFHDVATDLFELRVEKHGDTLLLVLKPRH